jgi:hypothetical protein
LAGLAAGEDMSSDPSGKPGLTCLGIAPQEEFKLSLSYVRRQDHCTSVTEGIMSDRTLANQD